MQGEIISTNKDFEYALKPVFELLNQPQYNNKFLTVTASGAKIYDCGSADTVINPISLEETRKFTRNIIEKIMGIGKMPFDVEPKDGIKFSDAYKLIIEDK